MNLKTTIIIILGIEVLSYAFILLAVPYFKEIAECTGCGYTKAYPTPTILYYMPGVIGLLFIGMAIVTKHPKLNAKINQGIKSYIDSFKEDKTNE